MAGQVTPQQIAQMARQRGLDPRAVLAVARQEGLGGGIGDGGHAYGPFQLNNAGGVISNLYGGRVNDPSVQQWAWSPEGITFALNRIAGVAKGLTGAKAVNAIVTGFERPANPGSEITRALAAYGSSGGGGGGGGGVVHDVNFQQTGRDNLVAPPRPPQIGRQQLLQALTAASGSGDYTGFFQKLKQSRQAAAQPMAGQLPVHQLPLQAGQQPPVHPLPDNGNLALGAVPLALSTRGGIQLDRNILSEAERVARMFGVRINSGYRSAAHNAEVGGAPHSDHLTGDAVDFTGNPDQLAKLYGWAQQQKFPYLEPMAQAKDHVHISFRRGR